MQRADKPYHLPVPLHRRGRKLFHMVRSVEPLDDVGLLEKVLLPLQARR